MRFLLLAIATSASVRAQSFHDFTTPLPLGRDEVLVIGFLGGFEKWNDANRSVRQTALRLRETRGMRAETLTNRNVRLARKLVKRALDANGNGKLDASERAAARIVIYGQSLGGAAAIHLARDLKKMGVPVLLTAQVDSVGAADGVIPSNVRSAVNYYQRELLTFWGRAEIKAADPAATKIIGNFQQRYPPFAPGPVPESPLRRWFGGGHARMEADPQLWAEIEKLIREAIRQQR